MKTDGQRLNMFVKKYKKQRRNTEKERYFQEICKVLTNHIRQLKAILLGYDSQGISPKVFEYMLKNMCSTTKIKDIALFRTVVQQIVEQQGFDQNDVEQLIYMTLIQLINSYKYEKISFLQYVTFLLPKRVIGYVWKLSKDAQSQLANISEGTENSQYYYIDTNKHVKTFDITEFQNLLTVNELKQLHDLEDDHFRKHTQIYKVQQYTQAVASIIQHRKKERGDMDDKPVETDNRTGDG